MTIETMTMTIGTMTMTIETMTMTIETMTMTIETMAMTIETMTIGTMSTHLVEMQFITSSSSKYQRKIDACKRYPSYAMKWFRKRMH